MAKRAEAKKSASRGSLLDAARKHQDALQAQGLSASVLERYASALAGVENQGKGPNVAAQTLMKDITNEVGEFQAAMRKEFPGNAQFQAFFKSGEPMPADARGLLELGRVVAAEAPNFSSNLIRYAINAATVKHLSFLCDQLEKEIGGADPKKDVASLEEQIRDVARRAFEGKPELAEF